MDSHQGGHLLILFLLPLAFPSSTSVPNSLANNYIIDTPPAAAAPPQPPPVQPNTSLEYIDPTLPPLLPSQNPQCSLQILQHNFTDTATIASTSPPAFFPYTPPANCPSPWSRVILDLSAVSSSIQKDRIAAIWIAGAEILRTSTPFSLSPGVFWRIRKDVTRYTALLRRPTSFSIVMLNNSTATLAGSYSVNVSLHFYRGITSHPIIRGLYREPADLIIPISNPTAPIHWFKITNETDVSTRKILIPNNTYRAVLEVYVSNHADDEYWYANPLRSDDIGWASKTDGLASKKPNGGFRQVVATIDGRYVGSTVPFPVISPGSVNPFFWAPVAAIGAYDHPSYDLELTPFVGELLDGNPHEFGLTVKESQPFWLVDANLHLWLDAWSDKVEGSLVRYKVPPLHLGRQADWKNNDGKSEMEGQVIIRFSGWVSSSAGNITTSVRHKFKFKSHVEVEEKGDMKSVEMESKARTNLRIEKDHVVIGRVVVETEWPLSLVTVSSNGGGGTRIQKTKFFHEMMEATSAAEGKDESWFNTITDRQESEGTVLVGENGDVVWGNGDTKSVYKFRDDKKCYLRTVDMVGGKLKEDEESSSCMSAAVLLDVMES